VICLNELHYMKMVVENDKNCMNLRLQI